MENEMENRNSNDKKISVEIVAKIVSALFIAKQLLMFYIDMRDETTMKLCDVVALHDILVFSERKHVTYGICSNVMHLSWLYKLQT